MGLIGTEGVSMGLASRSRLKPTTTDAIHATNKVSMGLASRSRLKHAVGFDQQPEELRSQWAWHLVRD
jgi:hypothetical protein